MVTIGLVNVVKNGMMHPSIFYDDMGFLNAGFRSGSKYIYTLFSVGLQAKAIPDTADDDTLLSSRLGIGVEYPIGKFFLDLDVTTGAIVNLDAWGDAWDSAKGNITADNGKEWENRTQAAISSVFQLRFTAGYKIFEHLGIFAGFSYDYLFRHKDSSPDPEDFAPIMIGADFGKNVHKLGFFGGVQF
jgi:hypothetical protein